MKFTSASSAAFALFSTVAFAQTGPVLIAPAPVSPIASPSTANAVLRTGTPVALVLAEELTTKQKALRVGQRFQLTTSSPILVQDQLVIPVGTPAIGEIVEVRNKGMWGKSGHFTGRLLYLTANGRQIHLTGTFDEKGSSGGAAAGVVSALIFLPAGFFMTGKSAVLPIGAPVNGFIDEDVQLSLAAATASPMVVPMTVPVVVPVK